MHDLNNYLSDIEVANKINYMQVSGTIASNIPSWVFKEYAMILSLRVMKIINSSYTKNKLLPIWNKQISF